MSGNSVRLIDAELAQKNITKHLVQILHTGNKEADELMRIYNPSSVRAGIAYGMDIANTIVHNAPTVEVKSNINEQIMWERNIALSQLEEIGIGLGAKMDVVKEVLEKQIPKKPTDISKVRDGEGYIGIIGKCPCCSEILEEDTVYCDCGQKLDWKVE